MGDAVDPGHFGRMKVVLLGPPGAGKGTQSELLSRSLGVPAISTGEMLRRAVAAESELGSKVSGIMALGNLVDDDTMAEVVEERLRQEDARQGFLLDGYPRTLPQAETLAGILARTKGELDQVLLVEVPEEEIVRRNLLRRREDDTEEVIRARLRVYREQTMPLIGYYTGLGILRQVDGNRPIEEVAASLLTLVGVGA